TFLAMSAMTVKVVTTLNLPASAAEANTEVEEIESRKKTEKDTRRSICFPCYKEDEAILTRKKT
ncbi:MAG: hypothetical protein ACI86X_000540, partial [Moritella sp.]